MRKAFTRAEISAVAFDIDGTLYADAALYARAAGHFLRNARFFAAFSKARKALHAESAASPPLEPFRERQARLLAGLLGCSAEAAAQKADEVIYSGLAPFFQKIKPHYYIEETFSALKNAGFKLGILSDFPPEQKGTVWGLAPLCDAVISAEAAGALKPSPVPFRALAEALGTPSERILYVGNSLRHDVEGARAAGLKTALILSKRDIFNSKKKLACDIYFYSYRNFLVDVINFQ